MEWRRFPPGQSPVSTFAYHEHRERAPHLEQGTPRGRMELAFDLIIEFASTHRSPATHVVDLGCGDGGMLQLLKPYEQNDPKIHARGYDFQPSNAAGWVERGVQADAL